jgi:RNA polymerase sigma factor (sigma-70 family)
MGKTVFFLFFPFFNLFFATISFFSFIFATETNYYLMIMTITNPRQQDGLRSKQRALKERARQAAEDFCAGNDHAFSELYDLYVQSLYNYGMRLTQDQELLKDCIHDVFVKVYSKRSEKHTINNLSSYLIISLKNRLLDEFRRNNFMDDAEVENYDYRQSSDGVENDYLDVEHDMLQTAHLTRLMDHLTRRQRQAITLYYLEERKYEEICRIMQMNYHSVRNLMHRGMLKLREAAL